MVTLPVPSNPDALQLLTALELFEQTFGRSQSQLELQAIIGALAAAMDLKDDTLSDLVHQVAHYYQQPQSLEELVDAAKRQLFAASIQTAKERLTDAEETLLLLVRTYLQRVSSKLSAAEFVEMAKAAIALLDGAPLLEGDPPIEGDPPSLSFPERKRLLYIVLQTFGAQLSQPIPALGQQIPQHISTLLARLTRYQKIIRTEGLDAVLMTLATQTLENTVQRLSPDRVRTALENSTVTIAPELATEAGLDDLTKALFFTVQLQTLSPTRATKSEQEIAEQLNQAIAEFKTQYQPLTDITQGEWDNDLSVSSSLFTPSNFATAGNDFTWLPPHIKDKNTKDDTNA